MLEVPDGSFNLLGRLGCIPVFVGWSDAVRTKACSRPGQGRAWMSLLDQNPGRLIHYTKVYLAPTVFLASVCGMG